MSDADPDTTSAASARSPIATFALGVGAMLVGFVVLPMFPVVDVAVLGWWLLDDLRRRPDARLGWLGWTSLGVFTALATATAVVVTSFDAHFDCGGTLGGYGEGASARLDTQCRDDRAWRVIVATVGTIFICGVGAFGLRRLGAGRSPRVVAASAIGSMMVAVGLLLTVLVVS